MPRESAAELIEAVLQASSQLLLTLAELGFAEVKPLAVQFGAVVSCLLACCLMHDPVHAGTLLPIDLVVTSEATTCHCLGLACDVDQQTSVACSCH